jgi:hypothetical protein
MGRLEGSVPQSFSLVWSEFDEVWRDMDDLCRSPSSPSQGPSTTPPLFQGQAFNAFPSSSTPPFTPALFQHLMRQVADELRLAGFVLRTDLDTRTNTGVKVDALEQTIDQVSGLRRCLHALEREFKDPDGTIAKLEGRIKSLEDRQGGGMIEQGGKTFRDVTAVTVWVQTFWDKNLYRYCVDMVTLIMLCAEPYDTIAEGMATAAAAHKDEYNSLTEASCCCMD